MLIALICRDKPGALPIRQANRDAHLAYLRASAPRVALAGPLLEDAAMAGSLIVLDVADMAAARNWADADPYARAGLFASVQMMEWKRVIG
jgi:uncharacterized protein YciI